MGAVIDVRLDNLSGYIANTAEKLSRAPKMAFAKMSAQPRMLAKKLVGAAALKQLKSFGNTQHRGQTDKQVDVVRFNPKLKYPHSMSLGNLAQKLFAMLADNRKLKRVFGVFWLPHKVERVLADAMPVVYKSFHFSVPPRIFCGAHAKCVWEIECANSAAHSSLYQEGRKYRGGRSKERHYFSSQFLPDLKVGGILACL